MLNLKGFYGRIKGLFRRNNYVRLIINAALGDVSYYCDCGIYAATKNPSSNVFDGGGSEALFERSKPRGFEAFMQRFTGIMVFLWIVDAIVLSILSSK